MSRHKFQVKVKEKNVLLEIVIAQFYCLFVGFVSIFKKSSDKSAILGFYIIYDIHARFSFCLCFCQCLYILVFVVHAFYSTVSAT